MKKVVIIDDEPLARSIIMEFLREYPVEIVAECENGFEGYKAIKTLAPDLVFLDIQMPKLSGFEMIELLEDPPYIIFSTAFEEFAIKAFEANALDYLLKPYSQERFDKAMAKFLGIKTGDKPQTTVLAAVPLEDHLQRIAVTSGSQIRIIPVNQVYCLEAYDDYVKIHTADDTFLKKQTLSFFENALDPRSFCRVHRSFLLQLAQVSRIGQLGKESHQAQLRNGFTVPLSRSGYPKLKQVLGL